MTRNHFRYGVPFATLALALLGISACAGGPADEDLGENRDNLQPCEYGAQCTTVGSTCHYDNDDDNGALSCMLNNGLLINKFYGTWCEAGMYCDEDIHATCPTEGGVLFCDLERRALEIAECGDGVMTPEAGEVCDDGNNDQCDGGCNEDCTVAITGCQDGVVCGEEDCDDGDNVSGDGCDANCSIPGCGNGAVGPGEDCDDGNQVNGDGCDNNCTVSECGNGIQGPDELCDDGNNDNGDGCDNNCTQDECGNGIVVIGEQCDDGNSINGDGCQSNCQFSRCGDSVVDADENCDDGNDDNTDGCVQFCATASCGDGYVQAGEEECDDGNDDLDDDCNPGCILPACGDGRQDANEECDDSNNTPGDGCSSVCTLEEACVTSEEDPDCLPEAYGCRIEGETCPYDADGPGGDPPITLECLCPNEDDEDKGSWLPEGSNCNDVDLCWVEGGVPSLSETCPGEPYTVTLDGPPLVITGTTVGAEDNLDICYNSDPAHDGGERVYHVTLPAAGLVKFNVIEEDDFVSTLAIRPTCGSDAGGSCSDGSFFPSAQRQIWWNLPAGQYYFIVDSALGTTGAYEATITLTTPVCGDGSVNGTGETCDGGGADNDGCIDPGLPGECTYEAPDVGADVCDGETLNLPAGVTNLSSEDYTTNGYTNNYQRQIDADCPYAGATGADRVFQLMPQATGDLTVTIGLDDTGEEMFCQSDPNSANCWDPLIYARSDCGTQASQLACADDHGTDYGETITFPVTSGVPVFLFIDGFNASNYSQGPFNLKLDLQP